MKAKRNLFVSLITLVLLLCCSALFFACSFTGGTSESGSTESSLTESSLTESSSSESSSSESSSKTYTVTFKVDGRNYDIYLVEGGDTVTPPTAPEKDGYAFDGWFVDEACTQAFDATTAITANTVVYAKMSLKNGYTVTYLNTYNVKNNNPTAYSADGADITLAPLSNLKAFTFLGWYEEGCDTPVTTISAETGKNVTLVAKWEEKTAHKSFSYNVGENGDITITGVKDTTVTELTVPDYVYSIELGAFKDCTSLQKLTVPYVGNRSNGEYGSIGYFFGTKSWKNNFEVMPESLTHLTVTGGYGNDEKLQANAFDSCIYLTDVTINDGVTYIGSSILGDCISLESLTLPFIGSTKMGKNDINSFTRTDFYYIFNEYSKDSVYADVTYRVIVRKNHFYDENWRSNNLVEHYEIAVPKSLTSITILGGIVPFRAFYPDSIWDTTNQYQYYSPITSITLGEDVSCIGDQAFFDLTNLKNLTVLGTLTDVGSRVFSDSMEGDIAWYKDQSDGCVYLGNALVGYKGSVPADGCITIQDGTVAIANNVFSGMSDLIKVELPNSLKYIGTEVIWLAEATYGAFNGCTNLTTVLGGSVEKLGYVAFRNCTSLTDISFAENVTYIAEYALKDSGWYYNKATEGGATYVGKVFYKYFEAENEENTTVEIRESTVGIAPFAFSYSGTYDSNPDEFTSIVKIVVPDTVVYIGSHAFAGCTNLKEINLPSALNQIGEYAFYGCSSLSGTFTISKNVKTLPRGIFQGCGDITLRFEEDSKLSTVFYQALCGLSENSVVYLPESVMYIEKDAFAYNTAIIVLETDKITAANAVACSSAKNIFYVGSKQTANGLTDVFSDVYYYSETEPPVDASTGTYDGNYWHYVDGVPTVWILY